jgi:hypothetical protein
VWCGDEGAPGGIPFFHDPQDDRDFPRGRAIHSGTAMSNMQRAVGPVVEGRRVRCRANARRSEFVTWSFRRFLPKGSPVELTYEYNANQVLEVSVEASGNRARFRSNEITGLAPNEVAQLRPIWDLCGLPDGESAKVVFPTPLPDDPHKWDGWSKYKSAIPYERLCLDSQQNPTNELIRGAFASELLRWWQKNASAEKSAEQSRCQLLRPWLSTSLPNT